MTKVLTLRVAPEELAFCDARARELGVTRTDYVRSRLFDDMAPGDGGRRRTFASMDLAGALAVGKGSTNTKIRAVLRQKKGS